jgi:hypothetical protein
MFADELKKGCGFSAYKRPGSSAQAGPLVQEHTSAFLRQDRQSQEGRFGRTPFAPGSLDLDGEAKSSVSV